MSKFLINIIATSNLAKELNKDTAAVDANTEALAMNTVAMTVNGAASEKAAKSGLRKNNVLDNNASATRRASNAVQSFTKRLLGLDHAQRSVGYNIAGLSIRVGAWFVPAMGLMYTSMLPVIAGLLTIASAAGVASLGLLGVLGVGALVMSKRFNDSNGDGYGGPRRPYGQSASTTTVWSVLFKPLVDTLDDAGVKGPIDTSVAYLKYTFGVTLPNAFRMFMTNVDPGAMAMIMTKFSRWLPEAARDLAAWGSELTNIIGAGSLERVNNLFKWIAQGIMNTADWLANGGGWTHIDDITTLLGDVIHTLTDLGKSVLPTFVAVLKQVWPNPLKPIIEGLTKLFTVIAESPELTAVVVFAGKLLALGLALKTVGILIRPLTGMAGAFMKGGIIYEMVTGLVGLTAAALGVSTGIGAVVIGIAATIVGGILFAMAEALAQVTRQTHPAIGAMWTNFKTFFHNIFAKIMNALYDAVNDTAWVFGVDPVFKNMIGEYQYITPEQYRNKETRVLVKVSADKGALLEAVEEDVSKEYGDDWNTQTTKWLTLSGKGASRA